MKPSVTLNYDFMVELVESSQSNDFVYTNGECSLYAPKGVGQQQLLWSRSSRALDEDEAPVLNNTRESG